MVEMVGDRMGGARTEGLAMGRKLRYAEPAFNNDGSIARGISLTGAEFRRLRLGGGWVVDGWRAGDGGEMLGERQVAGR